LGATGPIFESPISRIPNILDSFVEVVGDNRLFFEHGVKKRVASRLHIVKGGNTQINRYLGYVDLKLRSLVGRPGLFWDFAQKVMSRSNTFKALMLFEMYPHFHRDMNLKELYLLVIKYNELIETNAVHILHRRVYIPKKRDPETKEILS
jgi:hypothetical protein